MLSILTNCNSVKFFRSYKNNFIRLTNGEEIVALDHEKAFGFTFASIIPVPADIWKMNDDQKRWIKEPVLYSLIKRKKFDFESFSKKMLKLNDHFWKRRQKNWCPLPGKPTSLK